MANGIANGIANGMANGMANYEIECNNKPLIFINIDTFINTEKYDNCSNTTYVDHKTKLIKIGLGLDIYEIVICDNRIPNRKSFGADYDIRACEPEPRIIQDRACDTCIYNWQSIIGLNITKICIQKQEKQYIDNKQEIIISLLNDSNDSNDLNNPICKIYLVHNYKNNRYNQLNDTILDDTILDNTILDDVMLFEDSLPVSINYYENGNDIQHNIYNLEL